MRLHNKSTCRFKVRYFMTVLLLASACLWQFLNTGSVRANEIVPSSQMVRHFVALQFKKSASPEKIRTIIEKFKELQTKIPFVVSIECGPNISPERLNKGFTYGFLVTFNNVADRDRYLNHPEHLKFVSLLKESMEDAFVLDFSPASAETN